MGNLYFSASGRYTKSALERSIFHRAEEIDFDERKSASSMSGDNADTRTLRDAQTPREMCA